MSAIDVGHSLIRTSRSVFSVETHAQYKADPSSRKRLGGLSFHTKTTLLPRSMESSLLATSTCISCNAGRTSGKTCNQSGNALKTKPLLPPHRHQLPRRHDLHRSHQRSQRSENDDAQKTRLTLSSMPPSVKRSRKERWMTSLPRSSLKQSEKTREIIVYKMFWWLFVVHQKTKKQAKSGRLPVRRLSRDDCYPRDTVIHGLCLIKPTHKFIHPLHGLEVPFIYKYHQSRFAKIWTPSLRQGDAMIVSDPGTGRNCDYCGRPIMLRSTNFPFSH